MMNIRSHFFKATPVRYYYLER